MSTFDEKNDEPVTAGTSDAGPVGSDAADAPAAQPDPGLEDARRSIHAVGEDQHTRAPGDD